MQVTGPLCSFNDVVIAWCDDVTDHTRTRPSSPPEMTLLVKWNREGGEKDGKMEGGTRHEAG